MKMQRMNSLGLNFQFDIDNSKNVTSTILHFPPLNVKFNRKNNELTIRAKDAQKILKPILNKSLRKSQSSKQFLLVSLASDVNKPINFSSPAPYSKT